MKNLRKLLVALAILAVLVSSLTVIVVTAEDAMEYTGDLARAQALLDEVPGMDRTDSTTDLRKEAIKKVYIYLNTYPVDPETEGYTEFADAFYKLSLQIANKYYGKLKEAANDTAKTKQLGIVLAYLDAYYIPEDTADPDGAGTEYLSYRDLVNAIETFNYEMVLAKYQTAYNHYSANTPNLNSAMTSLKSVYTHVAKYPISENVAAGAALYEDYNLLSLLISEKVIADFDSYKEAMQGGSQDDKDEYKNYVGSNLSILRDHIVACPIDFEAFPELTERYAAIAPAISVAELDQIVFLFEDFENFVPGSTSTMPYPELAEAAALAKVSKALSDSTIPESTEGYAELVEKIKAAEVRLAAVKENRRLQLASQAKLYEYELTDNMSYKTFSSDADKLGNPNADRDEYSELVKTYDNGLSSGYEGYWRYVVLGEPNKHNTFDVSGYANTSYASFTYSNITNGFVFSFDYMLEGTNGTHYDKVTFSNEWQDSKGNRLVGYEGNEFSIYYDSATDSICVTTGNGVSPAVTVKNVAAEGQWFNVMYTYDPITHYGKLYIDYEYMFDFYYNASVDTATRMVMRVSHTTAWQNTCYDNISYYEGTAYRDVNLFNGMSENQLFEYYVNYFMNEDYEFKSRNDAYKKADLTVDGIKAQYESLPESEMTDELKNLRDLVTVFEAFDYNNVIATEVKKENLAEILSQVAALEAIPAYSTNVEKINKAIANLDQFIADNNDFIDKANAEYNNALMRVSVVKLSLTKCENVVAFAKALTQFNRATSLASMKRRAATLDEIYKLARYDKAENVAAVKDDPVLATFEQLINGKELSPSDSRYVDAFEYYNLIPAFMAEQTKIENSNRIIKVIDLLFESEGYEHTEEFWLANYENVEFYVSIVRDIVSVNNYDPTYVGVDEAIAKYEEIDAVFYDLLQEDHIAIIGAQLDRFAASTSYIEKIGICTYLDRYFASNADIDRTRAEIKDFEYRLERYKAELETYMDDYKELLDRNTQYFIDTIQKMSLLTTYQELKPLYDEALSYYYAMNAISDEAKAAVAIFDEYDERLTAIQINSELFVQASQDLDLISYLGVEAEFALLSECALYYDYIDVTYSESIASKLALYEDLVNSYNLAVDSANEVVETSSLIGAALRSGEIPLAVLAVINQLYKN